jgi:hypothetical protein
MPSKIFGGDVLELILPPAKLPDAGKKEVFKYYFYFAYGKII